MATLDPTSTHIPITPGGCTVQFMNPAPGPWQDVESLQDCLAFGLWPAEQGRPSCRWPCSLQSVSSSLLVSQLRTLEPNKLQSKHVKVAMQKNMPNHKQHWKSSRSYIHFVTANYDKDLYNLNFIAAGSLPKILNSKRIPPLALSLHTIFWAWTGRCWHSCSLWRWTISRMSITHWS